MLWIFGAPGQPWNLLKVCGVPRLLLSLLMEGRGFFGVDHSFFSQSSSSPSHAVVIFHKTRRLRITAVMIRLIPSIRSLRPLGSILDRCLAHISHFCRCDGISVKRGSEHFLLSHFQWSEIESLYSVRLDIITRRVRTRNISASKSK